MYIYMYIYLYTHTCIRIYTCGSCSRLMLSLNRAYTHGERG